MTEYPFPELDDERWEPTVRTFLSMLGPTELVRALVAISILIKAWEIESGLADHRG